MSHKIQSINFTLTSLNSKIRNETEQYYPFDKIVLFTLEYKKTINFTNKKILNRVHSY